ncbi:hypothetical protein IFR05_008436 [Cadophora sp. M221]|nr:hypothetical protein IFR05_008436 [Cadophora sp. M221]
MSQPSNYYSFTGRQQEDTASDDFPGLGPGESSRYTKLTPSDANHELQVVGGASTSTSNREVLLFDDKSLTIVKANVEGPQDNRQLVTRDGLVGHVNVGGVDGNPPFDKQRPREVSVSSATDTTVFSEYNSEPGYESSENTIVSQSDVISDIEPGGSDALPFEQGSRDLPRTKLPIPIIKSWSAPIVGISDTTPHRKQEPPKSEVSDGGLKEYTRRYAQRISSPKIESRQSLSLQDQFVEALVRPNSRRKGFFPMALIPQLVTRSCVIQELSQSLKSTHNVRQIEELADSICEERQEHKSFRKIFAVLVLIERSSSISKFVVEGVDDSNLPLVKCYGGPKESSFELRMEHKKEKKLECFDDWTHFFLNAFEEWQWTTVSPFFYKGIDKEVRHFTLKESIMLPFTADSRRDSGTESQDAVIDGGFSRVFKVNIHSDHHDIIENVRPQTQKYQFAIKRLHSKSKEDFRKEVEMLKRFSYGRHRHRNLISLLATYEQRGVYYLIFPCAGGDLSQFWKVHDPKPSFDLETMTWVADQCEGIAEGLLSIHRYEPSGSKESDHEKGYGRHGDLKPENILWFPNGGKGVLKISDFGLASFSTRHSRSYANNNSVAASLCYRAPEWDLTDGKIGQSYDIWTLGCLFLEFTTWTLGGMDLVKEFSMKRLMVDSGWYGVPTDNFFMLHLSRGSRDIAAIVKPSVTKSIKELHRHASCSKFMHDLLTMIECNMLLVKPNNPDVEPSRIDTMTVFSKLRVMRKRLHREPSYGVRPAPWTHQTESAQEVDEPVGLSVLELQCHKFSRWIATPVQDEKQHQI